MIMGLNTMSDETFLIIVGLLVFVGLVLGAHIGIMPDNWPNPYLEKF